MDHLPENAPEADLLEGEILITAEVARLGQQLSDMGVLTFGISDKPDEASLPPKTLAKEEGQPIHRTVMKVFG
jgi:hypothetical protein